MVAVHNSKFSSFSQVNLKKKNKPTKQNKLISKYIWPKTDIIFSRCSGDTASCLHNAPHEDDALGRALPGTLLSLDAQCRRDRGTSACFKDERVCAQLFCFDAQSGYCVAYRPAAEGSPCGDGSVSV